MVVPHYILLTGATGLLGRVLMRDFLRKGIPIAVLVRPSRQSGAEERVRRALSFSHILENQTQYRPIVIEGGIDGASGQMSLKVSDREWIGRHVREVVHCAASLSFSHSNLTNEPYRTNIDGTKALLDFCKAAEIASFHYVSTAYICGDRNGPILESQINSSQTVRNAYEHSKLQAELLIADAAHSFDRVTVYRPSIIVGEYTTGFTSTFHGFYLPLKILAAWLQGAPISSHPSQFWSALGMSASDSKNLVPVDWVSLAMARIITNPIFHGRTYHLTHHAPTSVQLMGDVFAEALDYSDSRSALEAEPRLFENFAKEMSSYRHYWRHDPDFDRSNFDSILPDLPPPRLTKATLLRLSRFALSHRFFWQD